MLTTSSRIKIQEILTRLSRGNKVTLKERIYINKYASRDQNVSNWLRKASKLQQQKINSDPIEDLLEGLNLTASDPNSTYNPAFDDLGEWFSGSPSWVRRS
tara:strand:- start:21 stop:323 length:303 start_codon:yes stop_codon:yes gene_type:complete